MRNQLFPILILTFVFICNLDTYVYPQNYDQNYDQSEVILPRTTGVFGNFHTIFQGHSPLITSDLNKEHVNPFYQYLDFHVANPTNGIYFNNYLRAREVIGGEDKSFDVYNAFFKYKPSNKLEMRLGRQVLTESFNFFLLDGGLVRFKPVKGIEFVTYGGYQFKDAQPDPEEPQEDTSVYGIHLKTDSIFNSIISVGYELLDPDGFSSQHLLRFSFNRVIPFTDYADLYSHAEYNIEEGTLSYFTTGVGITPLSSVNLNLEYETYDTDKNFDDFHLDRIFALFSLSRLHQARVAITYIPTSFIEIKSSYAFTHYDVIDDVSSNGHIGKLNILWDLRRQIGFRSFQSLYYIDGRDEDRAVGMNFSAYQEILRGLDLRFTLAYSHFETLTNKEGDAISYITGIQYFLTRNLLLMSELEANSNPDFDNDVRVNLGISYNFAGSL